MPPAEMAGAYAEHPTGKAAAQELAAPAERTEQGTELALPGDCLVSKPTGNMNTNAALMPGSDVDYCFRDDSLAVLKGPRHAAHMLLGQHCFASPTFPPLSSLVRR